MNGFGNEINTLTGTGTVENSAAGTTATLGVGVNNTPGLGDKNTEFDGLLQDGAETGTLGLAKLGDDTLTLGGANTYTGQTTVGGSSGGVPGTQYLSIDRNWRNW